MVTLVRNLTGLEFGSIIVMLTLLMSGKPRADLTSTRNWSMLSPGPGLTAKGVARLCTSVMDTGFWRGMVIYPARGRATKDGRFADPQNNVTFALLTIEVTFTLIATAVPVMSGIPIL